MVWKTVTSFYPCFRLRHYEVQRKYGWELKFNEINQFLTLIYRRNKNAMRNNETPFDVSKEVYKPRDVCGSYLPGTDCRLACAGKEFCKGCLVDKWLWEEFLCQYFGCPLLWSFLPQYGVESARIRKSIWNISGG